MAPPSATPTKSLPERQAPAKRISPLSNESKLTPLEKSELELTDKSSSPDTYINGETFTIWHPWMNNLEFKPLRFETRTRTFVVVLRNLEDTELGKNRHRGTVNAVTLKREWNYKGYVVCSAT